MKLNAGLGPLILDPGQLLTERNILDNLGNNICLCVIMLGQEGHHDLATGGLALLVEFGIANVVEQGCKFYELDVDCLAVGALFLCNFQC